MREAFEVDAIPVRDLGLRDADDTEIFFASRSAGAVVMTKDIDFLELLLRAGPPPQILWLTCGNSSNAALFGLLTRVMPGVIDLLQAGEPLVEIR